MSRGDFSEKVNFIWSVKEILRDHYKRHQYGEVILPLCVLRRLDCVLEPTKSKVVEKAATIRGDLDASAELLAHVAGQPFYNTSRFTLSTLLGDQDHIRENVHDFVNGFSPNGRDALDKFGFSRHIDKMADAGILYMVIQQFASIDLHPELVSNREMGYIYEELVRVTADLSNEEAGEHFTPREVIELMVNLLFADEERLLTPGRITTLYDPACGTGGMLSVAQEHLATLNPDARLHSFGQEIQPESYAVCRSDMMLKGQDASRIVFGDSFTQDGFPDMQFDYMLANPPFGKDWKTIKEKVKYEHDQLGLAGRFGVGLPPTSDGQMLFLQQMLSKMRPVEEGGSRIAIVFNGSPLFSGDAGSGMSEIRRWIIEQDWLDAVVGLPDHLFYNTGIDTYIWVLTNRKHPERAGYVQLIDARDLFARMRKSLGKKRNELTSVHIAEITQVYESFSEAKRSKILPTAAFGYSKITVERPLRVRFSLSAASLKALRASQALNELAMSDVERISEDLHEFLDVEFSTDEELKDALRSLYAKYPALTASKSKAILAAFRVRDSKAAPVPAGKGRLEADPDLRYTEDVPLTASVDEFVAQHVLPFAPDAWIDASRTKVGYEIPFAMQFYKYTRARPLDEIEAEIAERMRSVMALLDKVSR